MKKYISTRGGQAPLDFYQAIAQGIGSDGGLLVPDFELPSLDLKKLQSLDYVSLATEIVASFVPEEGRSLIADACRKAYGTGLFPEEVVPVKKLGDDYIAELFQGPTAAFKDMALTLLPHLMTLSLKKMGSQAGGDVLILAATSGDTGKAALEGFRDVEGTRIMVFYPTDGVSAIQKQQMVSQEGANVKVAGIHGNFDDAQRAVKAAFADPEIGAVCKEHGAVLSSANSINIGRLIPQIVYYVWSYLRLVDDGAIAMGDRINFCVPSGNFGNCLAGWLAKGMGLPVARFLVASNRNNILTDFFTTGCYDTRREFFKTNAPAMDILVSSNLERLLWYAVGRDGSKLACLMEQLKEKGMFQVDPDVLAGLQAEFKAGWRNGEQVLQSISECFSQTGYLLDTHTACAYGFLGDYRRQSGDLTRTVIMSTASPYKFPEAVLEAIGGGHAASAYEAIDSLASMSGTAVPKPLADIESKPVLHKETIEKTDIPAFIMDAIRQA